MKNEKSSNNISLNIDNETIKNDLTISNRFNNFFASVEKNLVKVVCVVGIKLFFYGLPLL